jgi:hypothetical protein
MTLEGLTSTSRSGCFFSCSSHHLFAPWPLLCKLEIVRSIEVQCSIVIYLVHSSADHVFLQPKLLQLSGALFLREAFLFAHFINLLLPRGFHLNTAQRRQLCLCTHLVNGCDERDVFDSLDELMPYYFPVFREWRVSEVDIHVKFFAGTGNGKAQGCGCFAAWRLDGEYLLLFCEGMVRLLVVRIIVALALWYDDVLRHCVILGPSSRWLTA